MIENRPLLNLVSHMVLIFGIVIVALPIWITFVAATHDPIRMTQAPIPMPKITTTPSTLYIKCTIAICMAKTAISPDTAVAAIKAVIQVPILAPNVNG